MAHSRFSIIIVSWNALHHLKRFLPSVVLSQYPDFEIIIADNASTDGSGEWVQKQFPNVRIVRLDKNYGYCGGNNRASAHANGDILVFLNNDVEVEPDWLVALDKCFENNPKLVVVQPKIRSYTDKSSFEYAGAAGGYIDAFGYPFCRGRVMDTVEKDYGQYEKEDSIFWASGAAFAIRKNIFEKMNGFDDDFEFHMEEIDLCWRIQNQDYLIGYCPQSVVYHLGGGSLAMGSSRKVYYNFRNNLIMLYKNFSRKQLFIHFPIRFFLDYLAAVRSLFLLHPAEYIAIMRAHAYIWSSWSQIRRKRKLCQAKRTTYKNHPGQINISLIWNYYFRKQDTFEKLEKAHPEKFLKLN